MNVSRLLIALLLVASFASASLSAQAQAPAAPAQAQAQGQGRGQGPVQVEDRSLDRVPFPPFKIIGNMYYVGTVELCSFLFVTPEGNILINANFEETFPLLKASIEKLGFKMEDTKILLASHAHGDHQQADAMFKAATGATTMFMEQDVPALKAMMPGGKAHPIDKVLKDGDTVSLGGTTLTAHWTPSHTRGCTTWTVKQAEGGKTYDVVILCSGAVGPDMAEAAQIVKVMSTLPGDIMLSAHPWPYNLAWKWTLLQRNPNTNPFINPEEYKRTVTGMQERYKALQAGGGRGGAAPPAAQ
jgi:metallo-beta-lactamase class B